MSEREEVERARGGESRNRAASPSSSTTSRLLERGRQVERDAQSVVSNIEGIVSDVESLVRTSLEARPYATLAVAAGAGFVVGGGLTFGVVSTLVRMGTRMATAAIVQSVFSGVLSTIPESAPSKERSQR